MMTQGKMWTGPNVLKCKNWFHEFCCTGLAVKTGTRNIRADHDNKQGLRKTHLFKFSVVY
jgi:hypothetical protein